MSVPSRSKFNRVPSLELRFAVSGSSLLTNGDAALPFQTPLRSGCPSAIRGVACFPWAVTRTELRHNAALAKIKIRHGCFIASLQPRLCGVWVLGPNRELAAIRKCQVLYEPRISSVFGAHSIHCDGVPDLQPSAVRPAQPRPAERAWTRHLKGPMLRCATIVLHVEIQVGVGIDPFHFRYDTRYCERLVEVELRLHRMMRRGGHPCDQQEDSS